MPTGPGCDVSGPLSAGGPIKNARLVAWDGERVIFTCRARHEEADSARPGSQQMTLPVADFLQRWLLHVPYPQTRTVRCSGLYHATQTAALLCAARRSGNRRWWSRWGWTGRRCVPSVGRPSRTVSHLWPAARVYRCHLTWRCAPLVLAGERAA